MLPVSLFKDAGVPSETTLIGDAELSSLKSPPNVNIGCCCCVCPAPFCCSERGLVGPNPNPLLIVVVVVVPEKGEADAPAGAFSPKTNVGAAAASPFFFSRNGFSFAGSVGDWKNEDGDPLVVVVVVVVVVIAALLFPKLVFFSSTSPSPPSFVVFVVLLTECLVFLYDDLTRLGGEDADDEVACPGDAANKVGLFSQTTSSSSSSPPLPALLPDIVPFSPPRVIL